MTSTRSALVLSLFHLSPASYSYGAPDTRKMLTSSRSGSTAECAANQPSTFELSTLSNANLFHDPFLAATLYWRGWRKIVPLPCGLGVGATWIVALEPLRISLKDPKHNAPETT